MGKSEDDALADAPYRHFVTRQLRQTERERDEARQQAERLREALMKYGERKPGCHIAEEDIFGPLDDCSCGLRALLARSAEKEGSRG